jgi:F-box and leucine-rich repeat protein 1 (S-phase kinase-associated protein 2)
MSENNDSSLTNEVTIYEDESDITYFNKSSKKRLLSASQSQRSPLMSLNKALPSTNQQAHSSKTKALDDSYYKRLQSKPMLSDPFALLSDEILLEIFQHLPKKALARLACVNSRFSRVVQDETLWIRMDLGNRALRRGSIGKILSRGLIILRLAQARIQSPIFESHFQLGFQSKLQYLDLSMASIDQTSLAQLLSTCRILKKLSLEQLEVDVGVCKEVAENKSLEVLNLTMCVGLNEECIETLMVKLKAITALNVSWTELSGDSVKLLVNNVSPTLMRFNIAGSRRTVNDSSEYRISHFFSPSNGSTFCYHQTGIQLLISRCPNIVELDVSDCTLLTSTSLQAFASLTKLEYLSVSRCYNIPMASYL